MTFPQRDFTQPIIRETITQEAQEAMKKNRKKNIKKYQGDPLGYLDENKNSPKKISKKKAVPTKEKEIIEFDFESNNIKISSQFMTRYEYTRLVGERAKELKNGDTPRIDAKGSYDVFEIATRELRERVSPWRIERVLPTGNIVICNPNEMHIRDY